MLNYQRVRERGNSQKVSYAVQTVQTGPAIVTRGVLRRTRRTDRRGYRILRGDGNDSARHWVEKVVGVDGAGRIIVEVVAGPMREQDAETLVRGLLEGECKSW